jgi:hypothetical protein
MVETEFSPDSIVQHSVLPKNDTDKNKGKRLVDYSRHLSTAERVAYTERIVSALNRQMLKMLTFLVQQLLKDAAKIRRMSRPQQPLDPLVNLRCVSFFATKVSDLVLILITSGLMRQVKLFLSALH